MKHTLFILQAAHDKTREMLEKAQVAVSTHNSIKKWKDLSRVQMWQMDKLDKGFAEKIKTSNEVLHCSIE